MASLLIDSQVATLIGGMHQTETIEDDVRLLIARGWNKPANGQQLQPRSAVRAAVLGYYAPGRQQTCRAHAINGLGGLCDQSGRLGSPGLLRHGGIDQQPGQAA